MNIFLFGKTLICLDYDILNTTIRQSFSKQDDTRRWETWTTVTKLGDLLEIYKVMFCYIY